MSIAASSDRFPNVEPIHIASLSVGAPKRRQQIAQCAWHYSAAEVGAFVDRVGARFGAGEDVSTEIEAFGFTPSIFGRLLFYRGRLQTAIVRNLAWQRGGQLTLPIDVTPMTETLIFPAPIRPQPDAIQQVPTSRRRPELPRITNLQALPTKTLVAYLEAIGEDSQGGIVGLDALLADYNFNRAIYHDLIPEMPRVQWAADHDLSIWDARGRLKLPMIPKGAGVVNSVPVRIPATSNPVLEGDEKRVSRNDEAFACHLAILELRKRSQLTMYMVCERLKISKQTPYNYHKRFDGRIPQDEDLRRCAAILERVAPTAPELVAENPPPLEGAGAPKNVFEAIETLGRNEDFMPRISDDFVPTEAYPGSREKIAVLLGRAEQGHPLWHEWDRRTMGGSETPELELLRMKVQRSSRAKNDRHQ